MKFALNGALTIGTLDGANIEIRDAVGPENFFLFGLTAERGRAAQARRLPAARGLRAQPGAARGAGSGRAPASSPPRTRTCSSPLVDALLDEDRYMVLADFDAYAEAQEEVAPRLTGIRRAGRARRILNVARVGRFSSDRTIQRVREGHLGHLLGPGDPLAAPERVQPEPRRPPGWGRSHHAAAWAERHPARSPGRAATLPLLRRTEEGSLAPNGRVSGAGVPVAPHPLAAPARHGGSRAVGCLLGAHRERGGRVHHAPVADVVVTATSPSLQGEQVVVTDARACTASRSSRPAHTRSASRRRPTGPSPAPGSTSRADRTLRLNVELLPGDAEGERSSGRRRAPTIDVGSSTTGVTVNQDFVRNIAV